MKDHLTFLVEGLEPDQLLSAQDVADMLGMQRQWVYRLMKARRLRAERIGRQYVVRGQGIVDYLNSVITYGSVKFALSVPPKNEVRHVH